MTQQQEELVASLKDVDPSAPSVSALKPMAHVLAAELGISDELVYPTSVGKLGNLVKQSQQSDRARNARALVVLIRSDDLIDGARDIVSGLVSKGRFEAALVVLWSPESNPALVSVVHGDGTVPDDRLASAFPQARLETVSVEPTTDHEPKSPSSETQVGKALPTVSFSRSDCELFERSPPGTAWRSLSEADVELGRDLRSRLRTLAEGVSRLYGGTTRLAPHVSLHNQSGRPSQDLWCCVFPEAAGNKSYTLQVALIVSQAGAEMCLCLGAGISSIGDPRERSRLEAELERVQEALGSTPPNDRAALAETLSDWDLRRSWREAPGGSDLDSFDEWLAYAAGPDGAAASVSRYWDPTELEEMGTEVGRTMFELADDVRPLFERIYGEMGRSESSNAPPAGSFDLAAVKRMIPGLLLDDRVIANVVAALDSGKHVVLTGPPGTGKTTLAEAVAKATKDARRCEGFVLTTATSDWTTYETIGGLEPDADGGLRFREGHFLEALKANRWLVVDELNRSNFDRALGQLFTVLSGQTVVLPYRDAGSGLPIVLVSEGDEAPPDSEPVFVPDSWRLIATMNVFDKALLFEMSYALMRRLAFVEVVEPSDDDYDTLIDRAVGDSDARRLAKRLLGLRDLKRLGPAVFIDVARFIGARRERSGVADGDLLFDAFYGFLLPQFEGIDDLVGQSLFNSMATLVGSSNRERLANTLREVLGIETTTQAMMADEGESSDDGDADTSVDT